MSFIVKRFILSVIVIACTVACQCIPLTSSDVLSCQNEMIPIPLEVARLDRSLAMKDAQTWVLSTIEKGDKEFESVFFLTQDGGVSWTCAGHLPVGRSPQIVYFNFWAETLFLYISYGFANQSGVLYQSKDLGFSWDMVLRKDMDIHKVFFWEGGVAWVDNPYYGKPSLYLSEHNGMRWRRFPLTDSLTNHVSFQRNRIMILSPRGSIVSYNLDNADRDTLYTSSLYPERDGTCSHETIWDFMATDDFAVLQEGPVAKCMAIDENGLKFRSIIQSREDRTVRIPTALYSHGDTVFVSLQNLAYHLRQRTLASIDGGRSWTDLFEGRFDCAYGSSCYSFTRDKDGRVCLRKITVRPQD